MSDDDMHSWKGKMVGTRSGSPHVEIRYYPFIIIISLGEGYRYKYYSPEKTRGINVHIGTSGAIQMTFDKFNEMVEVVKEAREKLEEWERER